MVAQSIFWLTLPAVVYGLLASFTLRDDSPPRWRSSAARCLRRSRPGRLRRSITGAPHAAQGHRSAAEDPGTTGGHQTTGRHETTGHRETIAARSARSRTEPVDPFAALTVQIRLGVVATQLRTIENDPRIWARARRFQATQHAYDELLAQACRLAGVEVDADDRRPGRYRTEPERLREEVELVARGWTW